MVYPILKTNTLNVKIKTLYPELFLELYRSVGWEAPDLDQITTALEHSYATFCAYDGDWAVGMARLLGDGAMSFYIKDFAVRPEYQGNGVGRLLMNAMEEYIRSQLPNGWAVSLELISSKGREPFYERFGFEQRPCDWNGAGMFKMIRKRYTGGKRMKLDGFGLFVEDMGRMIRFYRDVLGFEIRESEDTSNVYLVKDGTLFLLYGRKDFENMTSRRYEYIKGLNGHFEIALYVDTFEEVDKVYADAIAKGAISVLAPETEVWGQRTCYIADPEGNLVEIGSFNRPFARK